MLGPQMYSYLLVGLWAAAVVAAQRSSLRLANGLQEQRPPVARVGQAWAFQILSDTFGSPSNASIAYSATDLPGWATFDVNSLTLAGTPAAGDLTATYVTVVATDATGSMGQDGFHLLVADGPAPIVEDPVAAQLPNASSVSHACVLHYNGWLRVPPGLQFTVEFQPDTFANANRSQIYYTAYLANTTDLPGWLQFDAATITFSGTAPREGIAPITLFGSDHAGYGDVKQEFTILVEEHSFDLTLPLPQLNATANGLVNYTIPIDNFEIDYVPVVAANISAIAPDLSGFPNLLFEAQSRLLHGNLSDSTATDLPVSFRSSYGQQLNTSLAVNRLPSLFKTSALASLELRKGEAFSIALSKYLQDSSVQAAIVKRQSATAAPAVDAVDFEPSEASSWASFDAAAQTLSGTVPKDVPYDMIKIHLQAASASGDVSDAAILPIDLSGQKARSRRIALALGITLGILAAITLAAVVWCCCQRWRKKNADPTADVYVSNSDLMTPAMKSTPFMIEKDAMPDMDEVLPPPKKKKRVSFGGPKRFDMMRVFGSQQAGMAQSDSNDGLGLGISSPSEQHIVIMADGHPTFVPADGSQSDMDSMRSKGSSSVFYEDTDDKEEREGRHLSSSSRAASSHASSSEGLSQDSASSSDHDFAADPPRQRADFARMSVFNSPQMPNSPIMTEHDPFIPDEPPIPVVTSGIRSVRRPAGTSAPVPTIHVDPAQVHPHFKPKPFVDSPRPSLAQRFLPFGSSAKRTSIGRTIEPAAVADAEEVNPNRFSVPYRPDLDESATPSPIFYATPDDIPGTPTAAAIPYPPATPPRSPSPTRWSAHNPSEVVQLRADVGHPFSFVPRLFPPPAMSSPTRSRPKEQYIAVTDCPEDPARDRKPLPDWIHLNDRERQLEIWGIPHEEHLGQSFPLQIIKVPKAASRITHAHTGSVTSEASMESEMQVGRFNLTVMDRRASRIPASGNVKVVRY